MSSPCALGRSSPGSSSPSPASFGRLPPPHDRQSDGRATKFQPNLEVLDAREVPAVLTWTGAVDSNFWNGLNWTVEDPGQLDDGGHRAPVAYDDLVFTAQSGIGGGGLGTGGGVGGGGASYPDCYGMSGTYTSITLAPDYTHVVTATGTVTT